MAWGMPVIVPTCRHALCLLVALLLSLAVLQGQTPGTPAGHWEGAIRLPTTQLGIRVDLEHAASGVWSGTIDIPVQGLRGFKLGDVRVNGGDVAFAMPGIPGEPVFKGKLSTDAKTLSGDFTQSGQTHPFKLERKPKALAAGETPARGMPGTGLAGVWQGSLKAGFVELRVVLKVTNAAPGQLGGAMDSLDQGARDIPLTAATEKDKAVHLEAKSIRAVYDGTLSTDGSEISGDWTQGGQTLPLVFKRLEKAPETRRPQEPKKPHPYEAEEVVFENKRAGIKLAGTLTRPRSPGPHPAVVLITGSGPQDRDETVMGHRPFLVLADHLTRAGLAVLRFDDRGAGKSTGDFSKATHTDFVEDTLAAVEFLKTRTEIDPKRIGLLGHSEGGIVAPLAAVQAPEVAFMVLLAGVGVPMEDLLVRQAADLARVTGASEELIAKSTARQREVFQVLKSEPDAKVAEKKVRELARARLAELTEEQRTTLGVSAALVESQIQMATSPWFRQLLTCDPRPTLRKVKCPVLVLNGEKDVQVAAKENLGAIAQALAAGGNPDYQVAEFPGLNHLFQHCDTGAVTEYARIEETMAPEVLENIAAWIRARVAR